ncbi:MAG: DUF3703 domain-containing protein [Anaeromyxobacteraceae bacterium]
MHLHEVAVFDRGFSGAHVRSHWLMLRLALHRREPAAMLGQAARIVLGAVGSLVGSVPTGNTGGTNISMFKRLPIEPELLTIIVMRRHSIGSHPLDVSSSRTQTTFTVSSSVGAGSSWISRGTPVPVR